MMKKTVVSITNKLRLASRFAFRRIGLKGYQIHKIEIKKEKLIYIPIPKNASSTAKHTMYEIEFGKSFDYSRAKQWGYQDIHDYFKKRPDAFSSVKELKSAFKYTRFTIVRDPVERLISCYRNRIVDLGDLQADAETLQKMNLPLEPNLNTFVLNLKKYRRASNIIEHHSRPQSAFLGGTLHYLDYVFPIEKTDELYALLQNIKSDLNVFKYKSGGTEMDISDLSERALNFAITFYKEDYKLLRTYYQPKRIKA